MQAKANKVKFYINNKSIEKVKRFKYLGRWFTDNDDDTHAIVENIKKARNQWNSLANILKREGANSVCMGRFYLTIVQAVLLYGADSWTINERNFKRLQSFHNRAVRFLTGDHIQKRTEEWYYPNHSSLFKKARLLPIEKYLERRRGTLRKYLKDNKRELLEKAKNMRQHCYNSSKILWWKQKWIKKNDFQTFSNMWFTI